MSEKDDVTVFAPYPFQPGQKINISGGPRKGDWEVIRVGVKKVTLRCPVSQREFDWNRFCYVTEEHVVRPWPGSEE